MNLIILSQILREINLQFVMNFIPIQSNSRTVWKNEKFTLTEKRFVKSTRYFVMIISKPLLSRNFCDKRLRARGNFHTTEERAHVYLQKFREISFFTKELC